MNYLKIAYARTYQKVLYLATFFLNFREPKIINTDQGFAKGVKKQLSELGINDLFLVTDNGLYGLGILNPLIADLKSEGIRVTVYHDVVANPTISNVESGLKLYLENQHHAVIAIGGGSAMDCAKMIAARSVKPHKTVQQMKGFLKVHKKIPPFIAVPTTAGTGSETTVCAVIVNEQTHDKYSVSDPSLIPGYAIFEPSLLTGLPGHITSTTGMDALTHAVEAFIGKSNTCKTKRDAISATKLIFEYLEKSYNEPKNLEYRKQMQLAAFEAGLAFTRAYVGNVHAIAHALGGKYNVPHGLANAVILPLVLKEFGKSVYKPLAKLYDAVHGESDLSKQEKAERFIKDIEDLLMKMNIVNNFGDKIQEADLPFLVDHAYYESFPFYPTPSIFTKSQFEKIYRQLMSK